MRCLLPAVLFVGVMGIAASSRAQEELPATLRPPADDPRRGPWLEYERAAAQCPDEKTFRREVAYWVDGVDHLAADSGDAVHVRLEWTAAGYRGTVRYTNDDGQPVTETITRDGDWCPMLARWVALVVSERIPDPPPAPPPPPCPDPPPCPQARCPPARPPRLHPPLPVLRRISRYDMANLGLYGMALLTGGLTADPGAAFSVGVDLRGREQTESWIPVPSLGIELRVALPGAVHARDAIDPDLPTSPRTFDVSQYTAALVPCARWKYTFGCAVVQSGFYLVEDGKYVAQSSASLALGPRLGVRLPLVDHLALFAFGEALFAPVRIGFAPLADPDPNVVWLPSVAQGYGAAGIEFIWD